MLKWLGDLILKTFGWHWYRAQNDVIRKGVLIGAPHTSNWDFVFAMAALQSMRQPVVYMAKKELFKFPLGILMRFFNGVPVDRGQRNSLVDAMAELVKEADQMLVLIPPEGTRAAVTEWKSGFYWVAYKAGVPIYPAYHDYEKKEAGIGKPFIPTGDYAADLLKIKAFYVDKIPKFPDKFQSVGSH